MIKVSWRGAEKLGPYDGNCRAGARRALRGHDDNDPRWRCGISGRTERRPMKCLRSRRFWAHRFSQMSYFRYRVLAPTGEFAAGEVEVPSRQEIVRPSEHVGRTRTRPLARRDVFCSQTQRHREMTAFLRQLTVLVGGGLTLEAALQVPGRDTGNTLAWLRRNLDVSPGTSVAVGLNARSAWNRPWAPATISAALASLRGIAGQFFERCAPRMVAMPHLLVEDSPPRPTARNIVREVAAEPRESPRQQVYNGGWFAVPMLRIGEQTSELALIARHTTQFCGRKFGIDLGRLVGALTSTVIGTLIVSIMGTPLSNAELAA